MSLIIFGFSQEGSERRRQILYISGFSKKIDHKIDRQNREVWLQLQLDQTQFIKEKVSLIVKV